MFEKTNAADEKGGMPQLNPESFTSQVFWLFVLFVSLFLMNHYFFLPKINKIRKERDKTINDFIKEANEINLSIDKINEQRPEEIKKQNEKELENILEEREREEQKRKEKILEEHERELAEFRKKLDK